MELVDEPSYTFGSKDNPRTYAEEWLLCSGEYRPSSKHGILIDGQPFAIVGTDGGATGIHDKSSIILEDTAFIAVGEFVIAVDLKEKKKKWSVEIDDFTCFGIHCSKEHSALISHGELLISRFDKSGEIIWQSGGMDIFTEGCSLKDEFIEAIDFNGKVYRFDYKTGNEIRTNKTRDQIAGTGGATD